MYEKRTYRNLVKHPGLKKFNVVVRETDLQVQADQILYRETKNAVIKYRNIIERFIVRNPIFGHTLVPFEYHQEAPDIIQDMISSSSKSSVGPMACVAGVISEYVAKELLKISEQVVIENGGDIFMKINSPATIGIFAGNSPLSMRIGIRLPSSRDPFSICTSSGTIGHSLSFGRSDAVCVISDSGALADASATAIGNRVTTVDDIQQAIDWGKRIKGVKGIVIIKDDKAGFWGDLEIVRL